MPPGEGKKRGSISCCNMFKFWSVTPANLLQFFTNFSDFASIVKLYFCLLILLSLTQNLLHKRKDTMSLSHMFTYATKAHL